jgi:quercetin dioxygenase-like cupin family protein
VRSGIAVQEAQRKPGGQNFRIFVPKEGATMSEKQKLEITRHQPTKTIEAHLPAAFSLRDLKWEKGSGMMEGVEVAVVCRDPKRGPTAMFVKVNKPHKPGGPYRYHNATVHNFVVEGSVSVVVDGKTVTGRAGDYFRAPAGWLHGDSHGNDIVFMVVDPAPDGEPLRAINVDEREPAVV